MEIKVKNLTKLYKSKRGETVALNNVSVEFAATGLVCVVGESGSGKTTLINMLGGIDWATSGEVLIDGTDIKKLSDEQRDEYRREKVGFVFQNYALIDNESVYDNVKYALLEHVRFYTECEPAIDEALKRVGLAEYRNKLCCELSGGQKQRVAVARALVKKPEIVFADEPTGNLDSENSDLIFSILKEMSTEALVVVVTHDRRGLAAYADRELYLADGKIVSDSECFPENAIWYSYASEGVFTRESVDETLVTEKLQADLKKGKRFEINIRRFARCEKNESIKKREPDDRRTLSLKELWNTSKRSIQPEKKVYIISMLLIFVFIALLSTIITLINNDYQKAVEVYWAKTSQKVAFVTKGTNGKISEVDRRSSFPAYKVRETLEKYFDSSEIISVMNRKFLAVSDNSKVQFGETGGQVDDRTVEVAMMFGTSLLQRYLLWGHEPNTADELVINSRVAEQLGVADRSEEFDMYLSGQKIRVCGIARYDENVDENRMFNLGYYNPEEAGLIVYVGREYLESEKTRVEESTSPLRVKGAGLLNVNNLHKYTKVLKVIGIDRCEDENIQGLELKANEVIVSDKYAESENFAQEKLPCAVKVKDLSEEATAVDFPDAVNLFGFSDTFVIKGITTDRSADVYFSKEAYRYVIEKYFGEMFFDTYGVKNTRNNITLSKIKALYSDEFSFSDENLEKVYVMKYNAEKYRNLMLAVFAFFCGLTVVVDCVLVMYIFRLNRKKYAVLRMLGYSKGTLKKIQGMLLALVSIPAILPGVATASLTMQMLNSSIIKKEQMSVPVNVYYIEPLWVAVAVVLSLVILVLCYIINTGRALSKPIVTYVARE